MPSRSRSKTGCYRAKKQSCNNNDLCTWKPTRGCRVKGRRSRSRRGRKQASPPKAKSKSRSRSRSASKKSASKKSKSRSRSASRKSASKKSKSRSRSASRKSASKKSKSRSRRSRTYKYVVPATEREAMIRRYGPELGGMDPFVLYLNHSGLNGKGALWRSPETFRKRGLGELSGVGATREILKAYR